MIKKVIVRSWTGRIIRLADDPHQGAVCVGTVEQPDGTTRTGVYFSQEGTETLRFAMSDAAREALIDLLTFPDAGEEWYPPVDPMVHEWRLLRDSEIAEIAEISDADGDEK